MEETGSEQQGATGDDAAKVNTERDDNLQNKLCFSTKKYNPCIRSPQSSPSACKYVCLDFHAHRYQQLPAGYKAETRLRNAHVV